MTECLSHAAVIKLLVHRRSVDTVHMDAAKAVVETVAVVMTLHLEWRESGKTLINLAYTVAMVESTATLLFDGEYTSCLEHFNSAHTRFFKRSIRSYWSADLPLDCLPEDGGIGEVLGTLHEISRDRQHPLWSCCPRRSQARTF